MKLSRSNWKAFDVLKSGIISNKSFEIIDMLLPPMPNAPIRNRQPSISCRSSLTIVETGSFAGAARKLGRATSVISYAIANLEAQLGLEAV